MKNNIRSLISERIQGPITIASLYLVFGVLWILFSDKLVAQIAPNQEVFTQISIYKGWGYVVVTACLLFWLIQKYTASVYDSERQIHLIADTLPALIAYVDADQRYRFANKAHQDWFGGIVHNKTLEAVLGTDIYRKISKFVALALAGQVVHYETTLPYKQGGDHFVTATYIPDRDARGIVKGFFSMMQDTTGRAITEGETRLWANAFEGSAHGIAVSDPLTNRILVCNPAFARLHGFQVNDLVGDSIFRLFAPSDLDRIKKQFEKADQIGYVNFEAAKLHKDGSVFLVQMDVVGARGDNGELLYRIASAHDITENKVSEEALSRSEKRYRSLFQNMSSGFARCQMIFDKSGQPEDFIFLDVNKTFINQIGLDNLVGSRATTVLPGIRASNPELFEIYGRVAASGEPEKFETFLPGLGSGIWFSISAYSPEKGFFVAVFDVITERKQAEQALKRNEQIFRLFLEHAPAEIAMFDRDMKYIAASRRYIQDYRLGSTDIVGRSHYEIFPDISEHWKGIHQRCLAGATERRDADPFPRANGNLDWVKWEIHPWYENAETIGGIILMSEVITERKRMETELRDVLLNLEGAEEQAELGSWYFDIELNTGWWSKQMYRLFGLDPANGVPTNEEYLKLIHPEDRGILTDTLTQMAQGVLPEKKDFRIYPRVGGTRILSPEYRIEKGPDGKILRFSGTVLDITKRKAIETELQQRNDDLGLINEINAAAIQGDGLYKISNLLAMELRRIFSSKSSAVYILSPDEKSLSMQQYFLTPEISLRVEKLIGRAIPLVNIPIVQGGYFEQVLSATHGVITTQPEEIQGWLTELLGTTQLQTEVRDAIRRHLPRILKILDIKSTISVPLITDGKTIGLLDIASSSLFSNEELRRIENISRQLTAAFQRQRVNEQLRQSEGFLQSIQNALSASIAILNKDGLIVQVNSAWRKFAEQNGLEHPGYGIGLNYLAICDSASGPNAEEAMVTAQGIRDVMSGRKREVRIEYPCHSSEEKRWFVLRVTKFEDGDQIWVVIAHENITDRKLAENALRQGEEKYRLLFESNPLPMWIYDLETLRFLKVNLAALAHYGYSVDEFMSMTIKDIRPLEDISGLLENISHVGSGIDRAGIWQHYKKDGSLIQVEIISDMVEFEGRRAELVLINDVTQRRQAETKLSESERRYRVLFEDMPVAIWEEDFSEVKKHLDILKHQGITDFREYFEAHPEAVSECVNKIRILDVNNTALRMYGADSKEQLINDAMGSQSIGEEKNNIEDLIAIAKGRTNNSWEGHDETFTGETIEINLSWSVLPGYEENYSRVIVTTADITERKKTEAELRASEERFRQLANNIQEVFWITNAVTGEEIYLSPASKDIWGFTTETLLYNPNAFIETIWKEDRTLVLNTLEIQRTGKSTDMEYRVLKPDGSIHWIWDRAFPIFDEAGKVVRLTGIAADITERKQAEADINRHLAELEALYENGLAVSRLLNPKEIGQRLITTFAKYLSWHHVTIRLRKEDSDELELIAFHLPHHTGNSSKEVENQFTSHVSRVGQGLSGWVVETGQPVRTGNLTEHPQYANIYEGMQSGLYMPLKIGDRVIGVISVESDDAEAFSMQDERLLATLASQAAVAFENARLYQSARQEISERERAEQALRASETHYRELADSITDVFFELDQNLRYTYWNKASELLTSVSVKDAIGKSMPDIFGSSNEQIRIERILRAVLEEHKSRAFETQLDLHHHLRTFEINAYPSTRGVSVVAKDVTDRKRAETLMQKRFELMEYSANHTLQELMQRALDEICAWTQSQIGFFQFIKEDQETPSLQIWSTDTFDYFNMDDRELIHNPVDQAGVWADAIRQRRPIVHNDYEMLEEKRGLPVGHVPLVREIVLPIIRNEKILGVIGVGNKLQNYTRDDLEIVERFADYAWDVTERKQMAMALAEERNQLAQRVDERTAELIRANSNLARALRVKDEFLANMSHELRTPLNAILGLSESLAEQFAGPLNDKQIKYINTISESGHHLLSLINDILDLAKIEAGQITLNMNKVDVNSVSQASLRMIKQLAQKKNQEVSVEIDHQISLMWADERRLKQMMVNLLSNAVKFTPEGGKLGLQIHGDRETNTVLITVWDNGIGMKEEDLSKIFKPFVQLDSGLARESSGTGLGLVLVAQMARLHGGSVSVTTELGKGSRFSIRLPWEPTLTPDTIERMKVSGKYRGIKPGGQQRTVLVIEDTEEVVMMVKDYLEIQGFKVVTAEDGQAGVEQARLIHPDLILMDIQMPRMDGLEATQKLRQEPEFKYTPIIALTALAMPNDRERCLAAGMDEYISKPVNLKALTKIIASCLSAREERTRPR